MKKISLGIVLILVSIIAFTSCSEKKRNQKARSIGVTSEILFVLQNNSQWDKSIGKSIRDVFGVEQYGMIQGEKLFKLSYVEKPGFSNLFKKHHSVFIVDIDKSLKEPKIETNSDIWAQPQRVFKLSAPNYESFDTVLKAKGNFFIESFGEVERARILNLFRATQNGDVVSKIKKTTGLSLVIPSDFYLAANKEDFVWIRKETPDMSQALIIISNDYMDTAQFSKLSIVENIKKSLKANVPGAVYESYMSIDEEFTPPVSRRIHGFPGGSATEITGNWKVVNDFMGGPFRSYTFFNKKSGKIVTLMAYVYRPNEDKRDLLTQMEAICYSVKN